MQRGELIENWARPQAGKLPFKIASLRYSLSGNS
jgi:hypothetical protein